MLRLDLDPYLPFRLGTRNRPPARPAYLWPLTAPFLVTFLLTAWLIFLPLVRTNGWIPHDVRPHIGFVWALWFTNPFEAFFFANVGLIVQHSWGQIVYISLLLLLVGVPFERRHGPGRAFLMFYGACVTGVSLLAIVILTTSVNGPHAWSAQIAQTSWSGASVGAFGLLGATIATARNPWPLVAAWVFFEYFVEWGLVPGLAVSMHIAGFVFGFVIMRIIALNSADPVVQPVPAPVPVSQDDEP